MIFFFEIFLFHKISGYKFHLCQKKTSIKIYFMKNVKLSLLAVLFTASSFVFANANTVTSNDPVIEQVKGFVKYPNFGYDENLEGKVTLVYSITSDNQIKIEQIFGKNQELKDYVRKSLEGKTVNNENALSNENYAIAFVFEFEN